MFTMDDLFEVAIKMEENGEAVYKNAIEKIKHKELRSLLEWMASEEATHNQWFSDQKNSLSLQIKETHLKQMVPQALQAMMGEKTLALEDIDFTTITTVSDLLKTFIGFENDTILFYELLEMFIEDDRVLNGLKKIIAEEKNHVDQLRAMMADLPEQSIEP